jgi:hypothetical protein
MLVIAVVAIIILFIVFMLFRKKKKLEKLEGEYIAPNGKKLTLGGSFVGKPGALSGPTITFDQEGKPVQQPQMPAGSAGAAQTYTQSQPQPSAVPMPTPAVSPPAKAEPAQLPPAPFELPKTKPVENPQITRVDVTTPTPKPTPIPKPVTVPYTVLETEPSEPEDDGVVPDFGIEGGPKPVQKDSVVHDIGGEQVMDAPDLSAAIEDLRSAGEVTPTEEGTVEHEGDGRIWKPDDKKK